MSIEKCIAINPENIEPTTFVFKILFFCFFFWFHFVSARQYLDCYFNEYPVKKTALLYLHLPNSDLHFFSVFLLLTKLLHGRR